MGHAVPDRLFWAHDEDGDETTASDEQEPTPDSQLDADDFPLDTTKH